MKLLKPSIPKELDADVAMSVIIPHAEAIAGKSLSYLYEFKGVSERTALGDNLNIGIRNKQNAMSVIKFSLKRDSIYHILPEYLFHPLDHYLGTDSDTEEFDKRYKEQEEQKNKALTYFGPFDQRFQHLRTDYQQWLNEHIFSGNQFLADFITDGYETNLGNPYIKAVYACIPWLRDFRGNDDMIRTALEYAFRGNAEIHKEQRGVEVPISENIPSRIDGLLGNLYCGSIFKDWVWVWKVFYQTKIDTARNLNILKQQIREFSDFFSRWFLPVESKFEIEFGDRLAIPELSETETVKGIFLNYSTQLI
ncbi:hypothetical protein [Parabacteroides pacaensis]|uniref:hypothetical protein n=1 Tax=Parabacteroides pacaensis TaxID=2086575 RepID=UPI000D0E5D26|nr:hypothetical protein [Parabacteroides pacaensis]